MSAARHEIETEPQKCTGCLRCKLICSFQHKKEFNLDQAYILIVENDQGIGKITFTDDCDMCGLCVQYCVYGALKFRRRV